jgi:hypothetical protein
MRHFSALAAIGLLAITAAVPVGAATSEPPEGNDASSLSCADFNAAASQADPPKDASAEERRRALDAQDYIANGMVWIHGYLTGHNGPETGKLTRDWVSSNVAKLSKACLASADPASERLVDLVQKP